MVPPGASEGLPRSGYYPDPSIPGYIRYWNGSAWVPGTSRPEPREGEPLPEPPSAAAASSALAATPPAARPEPAPAEETGPIFLDEEPVPGAGDQPGHTAGPAGEGAFPEVPRRGDVVSAGPGGAADRDEWGNPHGLRPETASAWHADAARQSGFPGQSEERVSWGRPAEGSPSADPRGGWGRQGEEDRPGGAAARGPAQGAAQIPGQQQQPPAEGTFQMRAVRPDAAHGAAPGAGGAPAAPDRTVGLRRADVLQQGAGPQGGPAQPTSSGPGGPAAAGAPPAVPGQGGSFGPGAGGPAPAQVPHQGAPAQPGAHQGAPAQPQAPQPPAQPQQQAPQGAAAQPSWAQQVHDLAAQPGPADPAGAAAPAGSAGGLAAAPGIPPSGGPEAVTPWRPPVVDPFLAAIAGQDARPAALGRRFGARLVDAVLTGAVGAAAAYPFAGQAVDHVQAKMDAVRQAGVTQRVWLIDGTTGGYLAVVLGVLLVFGLLYEVLPTWRWGWTPGKKLFGLRVLDVEQQMSPGLVPVLLRWLVYGVLALLVVGVVNVLWCLFDRPWRQCWHDKVARTFVAKDPGEVRL